MERVDYKKYLFDEVKTKLVQQGFFIEKQDQDRPWGGFFVIQEGQSEKFASTFFKEFRMDEIKMAGKLSPKILIVAPEKRLSWQYHLRRAEIWKVLEGEVAVVTSPTDTEEKTQTLINGDVIKLEQGERHRLVGRKDWGIIAELWQHTSEEHPSDEADIVRVQDDFGR